MKRITQKQVLDILLTLLIPGASFGIGILRKAGYTVKNSDFFKIGILFALAAIIPAYIYLWLMYGI